jgi:hypothetical protein
MTEPVHLMTGMPAPTAPILTAAAASAPEPFVFGNAVTDLDKFRAQGFDGLEATAGISFQPGGAGTEVFTVRHALLLSDEQNEELARPQSFVDIAKLLFNTDSDPYVYDRFKAAGGRAGDVMIAWRRLSVGLDVPK